MNKDDLRIQIKYEKRSINESPYNNIKIIIGFNIVKHLFYKTADFRQLAKTKSKV